MSNKSLGRFGDGEIAWLFQNKEKGGFEENSPRLSRRLAEVITSNNNNFLIGLPDSFISIRSLTNRALPIWGRFLIRYSNKIISYLNYNKIYYDANVVRPYIDYQNYSYSIKVFNILKKIWSNKNILIVEGNKTRLGLGNDLFNNTKDIRRIECPNINAFESYSSIYNSVIKFLNKNKNYITLISLGPTATVLSYDVFEHGYRAIDVGHIDSEYMWCLMKATVPVNIPYKYSNEVTNDENCRKLNSVSNDKLYLDEIINIIK